MRKAFLILIMTAQVSLFPTMGYSETANLAISEAAADEFERALEPLDRFLGAYYLNNKSHDEVNCPVQLNIGVNFDGTYFRLVGLNEVMKVGYNPKLSQITTSKVDMGSKGRRTQFVVADKVFTTIDTHSIAKTPLDINDREDRSNELTLELIGDGYVGNKAEITITRDIDETSKYSCEYLHTFFNR